MYAVFNDTVVKRYDLAYYGEPNQQYLDNKRLSYPKVNQSPWCSFGVIPIFNTDILISYTEIYSLKLLNTTFMIS